LVLKVLCRPWLVVLFCYLHSRSRRRHPQINGAVLITCINGEGIIGIESALPAMVSGAVFDYLHSWSRRRHNSTVLTRFSGAILITCINGEGIVDINSAPMMLNPSVSYILNKFFYIFRMILKLQVSLSSGNQSKLNQN
jgi:hypothetical protein